MQIAGLKMATERKTCTRCSVEKPGDAFYKGKARCKACLLALRLTAEPKKRCGACARTLDRDCFRRYARRCRACEGEEGIAPATVGELGDGETEEADAREVEGDKERQEAPSALSRYLRRLVKNSRFRAKAMHRRRWAADGVPFEFDLTAEHCEVVWEAQGGACALTGQEMTTVLDAGESNRAARVRNASLDRIDSGRPYSRDNVHLVCSAANVMKAQLDMAEFVRVCRLVADTHPPDIM